ncbi:MAG: hypothetical protein U0821_17440 [Chloroflexota bacterium]
MTRPVVLDLTVVSGYTRRRRDVRTVSCRETRELIEDIGSLSPMIATRVREAPAASDAAREAPALAVRLGTDPADGLGRVRYLGQPSGYEFSSLLATVVDVSRGDSSLQERTRCGLATLTRDVHIQVFVTPP